MVCVPLTSPPQASSIIVTTYDLDGADNLARVSVTDGTSQRNMILFLLVPLMGVKTRQQRGSAFKCSILSSLDITAPLLMQSNTD